MATMTASGWSAGGERILPAGFGAAASRGVTRRVPAERLGPRGTHTLAAAVGVSAGHLNIISHRNLQLSLQDDCTSYRRFEKLSSKG